MYYLLTSSLLFYREVSRGNVIGVLHQMGGLCDCHAKINECLSDIISLWHHLVSKMVSIECTVLEIALASKIDSNNEQW